MANQAAVSEAKCNYDVFLCFRGEDTRYAFTGNLYRALRREGIKTFMDDEHLTLGEQIAPAILKAIKESMISIVVFSETFADSTWCLDELDTILECHKEKNQIVFPIFYKVEPSDVRYQKNGYGEAMTKHESRFGKDSEKVRKWRSSLVEASNLKGYHLREGMYEYQLTEEIVNEASIKLSLEDLFVNRNIIEPVYRRVREIEYNNIATRFLVSHGTGGIGKTILGQGQSLDNIGNQMLKSKSQHFRPTKLSYVFHRPAMARHGPAITAINKYTIWHSLERETHREDISFESWVILPLWERKWKIQRTHLSMDSIYFLMVFLPIVMCFKTL